MCAQHTLIFCFYYTPDYDYIFDYSPLYYTWLYSSILILHLQHIQDHGIDWDGPLQDDDMDVEQVIIPESHSPLTEEHYSTLQDTLSPLSESEDYGIDLYIAAMSLVEHMLSSSWNFFTFWKWRVCLDWHMQVHNYTQIIMYGYVPCTVCYSCVWIWPSYSWHKILCAVYCLLLMCIDMN